MAQQPVLYPFILTGFLESGELCPLTCAHYPKMMLSWYGRLNSWFICQI